jgi:uncharacterized GH25 family protein
MKMRFLLAMALATLSAQPLYAHRFWIVPSSTVLSGEKPWITVDAAISNSLFFADHAAPALEMFSVLGPDGKSVPIQNGNKGKYRTTFDLELPIEGTYKIVTARSFLSASWVENGETKRWRGTAESFASEGIKDKPNVQVSRNASRVEAFVTSGKPDSAALKPTGEGLELAAVKSHPNDLFSGEKARFVLLADGKPAAGVEVILIRGEDRYRTEPGEYKTTTSEDGSFELEFKEAGRYWLNASTAVESKEASGSKSSSRYSYTATFEVLPQ